MHQERTHSEPEIACSKGVYCATVSFPSIADYGTVGGGTGRSSMMETLPAAIDLEQTTRSVCDDSQDATLVAPRQHSESENDSADQCRWYRISSVFHRGRTTPV